MFLQLQLLMAATATGLHVITSAQSGSAPDVFALIRESPSYLIARSKRRRSWTQSWFQEATVSDVHPSVQGLLTGSCGAQTGRVGALRSAEESMAWRQPGYSTAVKPPLIGITRL